MAPKPPKPKDVVWRCAVNVLSLDQCVGADVFDPYVVDAALDSLGLRQCVSWSIFDPKVDDAAQNALGLRQALSFSVSRPPGPQEVSQDLGLRQSVSWGVVASPGVCPVDPMTSTWWRIHAGTFINQFTTPSEDDALTSSVLVVLAHVDPAPPTSKGAAMARLAAILAGTEGLEAIERVLD